MDDRKVLVVFHSASGNTRQVAQAIAEALPADVEQIQEVKPRPIDIRGTGLRNVLNMGRVAFGAFIGRATPIKEAQRDPAAYDLVVIGTPVYAGSVAGPVRAYLDRYRSGLKAVAFFCTGEDPHNTKVFRQMEALCTKSPEAVFAFHAPRLRAGEFRPQVDAFISGL